MKKVFRRGLRSILRFLCLVAVKKHDLEIVAVSGWYGVDITREAMYTIIKRSDRKVRRVISSPLTDWDVPVAILGLLEAPKNIPGWIYALIISVIRLLFVKPNPSIVVLQLPAYDAGIMKYWMSFIRPDVVCVLSSQPGTLQLELLLADNVKEKGLLILNADNIRTKSIAQGKKHVIFFSEKKGDVTYRGHNGVLLLERGNTVYTIEKTLPEFSYAFIAAAACISFYYTDIDFSQACESLRYFELPSDKLQKVFHKFIED